MANNLKLFLGILAACLLSSSASGNIWNDPYYGAMVGYESGSIDFLSGSEKSKHHKHNHHQVQSLSFDGISYHIVGGYGKFFNKYYLGIDAAYSLSKANKTHQFKYNTIFFSESATFINRIEKKNSYRSYIRGGYHIHDNVLPYLLLGIVYTRFNIKITNESQTFDDESFVVNISRNTHGRLYGLGIDIKINDELFGRVEFCHLSYQRVALEKSKDGHFTNATFKPKSNEIKIGLFFPIN